MTDLVSGLGMTLFPVIGLVLFGLIFLVVSARALRGSRSESAAHARMPLEDERRTHATEPTNA